ncbi:MAG TPA: hypothetical protein VFT72_02525 [Opitutaceae bacterium]|nr:hypothetical protein [Opitutaceae bacterium]
MSENTSARESLSRTPSWIMLGFVIGCIVSLSVKKQIESRAAAEAIRQNAAQGAAPTPTPTPTPVPQIHHATLNELEAVFVRWQSHAVWRNDLTEVAFWNPLTNQYNEYVEILRSGEDFYFRNITHLTRPLSHDDIPHDAPLRFTDPEERVRYDSIFVTPSS